MFLMFLHEVSRYKMMGFCPMAQHHSQWRLVLGEW